MENASVIAQIKALLEVNASDAHLAGHTAGRAFEAERVRQEANRLAAEQEALHPDQQLKSIKAVVDELLRRLAVGIANFPVAGVAREGFVAVAPMPSPIVPTEPELPPVEPEAVTRPLTAREERAAAKAAKG